MQLRSLVIICFLAISFFSVAQTPADVYRRPLEDVLKSIEKTFNVQLKYDDHTVSKRTVEFANWRFTSDVKTTLDNVLRPLDLIYRETGKNNFTVSSYDYYRRSEAEGKKHLDQLLAAYPTAAAFDQRKADLRKSIAAALGLSLTAERTALNPIFRKKIVMDGYTVENVAFESIPGYYVTGTLYRPLKGTGPFPVILNPHGHFFNEQDPPNPKDSSRYRADMQIRCATLARMGAIALSYDMYAWGESALMSGSMSYHDMSFAASIQTWNSIRALDFLVSLPNADKTRVGVTGASGGGTQAFLLAALDERVTVSVPVVMVSSAFYGGCACESGLPIHDGCNGYKTNNTEIAAMFAPRPLMVISDGDDWTASVPGTDFPYLQKVFDMYGKRENVESVYLANEGHDYGLSKRIPAYKFLAKGLGLNIAVVTEKDGSINEKGITIQSNNDLRVFSTFSLPANALRSHIGIVKQFELLHKK
jgi:dienelactone hydrolase